jgi:putative flippase GtrA
MLYSVIATVLDVLIVIVSIKIFNVHLIYANTLGVIAGFIVHYMLSSKSVFHIEYGAVGFLVYVSTFLFGIVLADAIIYLSYEHIFYFLEDGFNFIISKSLSIALPFFIMYFMRKHIYNFIRNKKEV